VLLTVSVETGSFWSTNVSKNGMDMNQLMQLSQPRLIPVNFNPFAEGELQSIAPTTESQQEIWLAAQMGDEANCAFNMSILFKLCGSLDVKALRVAFKEIIRRHDALRMTFNRDGSLLCISPCLTLDIPFIDLSALEKSEREKQWEKLKKEAVEQPFNLEKGPLLRVQLVEMNPQEHWVIFTAHHIVFDGSSLGVLCSELGTLYSAFRQGTVPTLPEPDQFSEYALWQQQLSTTPEYRAAEEYWLRKFSDKIPVLALPTDRLRPSIRSFRAAREDWEIAWGAIASLKKIGAKCGCTFVITVTAAFEVFLYSLTQQEDLVVGIAAAGQSVSGKSHLIGHCVNLLPSRTHIDGKVSFLEYLHSRRSTLINDYEHQQITFGRLLKKLRVPRCANRIPLVSIRFNIDRISKNQLPQFERLDVTVSTNSRSYEPFELFIDALETESQFFLRCYYNTDLFDAKTIRSYLKLFEDLLSSLVNNPELALAEYAKKITTKLSPSFMSQQQELQVHHQDEKFVPPRDTLEHQLIAIWEQLFQLKSISVKDDFFELGGNSFMAAHLAAKAEQLFGKIIGVKTIFRFPTVEQLAQIVRELGNGVEKI